ncbi:Phytanoyl-CoA dioxygenase (PhyH) [Planctomycetes bacterium Poly30]|uniref:Phytanoyl-CoA dioxygenase (PhyH) n=1 Tax=Saltatorellus ferox TaxID=2528018 RepID=A0A518EKI7_9BACT|nr:Phytanoyl-CoA dioxygenase (PhyH) [Planctomycetes bacterium Poly30]
MSDSKQAPSPILPADREAFERDGYVHVTGLLNEATLAELEVTYMRFLRGEIPVEGRDFCDMAAEYQTGGSSADDRLTAVDRLDVLNVMLPRRYLPEWRGNAYERAAAEVARALLPSATELDYDQLVAKPPRRPGAVFHWHQDLAYWPATPDPETVTVWLALDDTGDDNGCLNFVPGSHLEPELRPHVPLHGDRDTSHTIVAHIDEAKDHVVPAPIRRGDALCFRERILHGSGGNTSDRWRRAYVVAYRSRATVEAERAMGFTHSHGDDLAVLEKVSGLRSS